MERERKWCMVNCEKSECYSDQSLREKTGWGQGTCDLNGLKESRKQCSCSRQEALHQSTLCRPCLRAGVPPPSVRAPSHFVHVAPALCFPPGTSVLLLFHCCLPVTVSLLLLTPSAVENMGMNNTSPAFLL